MKSLTSKLQLFKLVLSWRSLILLPFLFVVVLFSILVDFQLIYISPTFAKALSSRSEYPPTNVLLFGLFFFLSSALRLFQAILNTLFTQSSIHDLSSFCFSSYIGSSYPNQKSRSLSSLLTYLSSYIEAFSGYLSAHVQLLTSICSIGAVLTALITYDPWSGFTSFALSTIFYLFIAKLMSPQLRLSGSRMSTSYAYQTRYIKEVKTGLRYTFIDQLQDRLIENYTTNDRRLRRSITIYQILASLPRNLIETVALLSIFVSVYLFNNSSILVPISVFAIAAQRLLPVVQQAFSSWATIKASMSIVDNIYSMLHSDLSCTISTPKTSIPSFYPAPRIKSIQLQDISFSFVNQSPLFSSLNLELTTGSAIMLSGPSGSGKSTLLDLVLNLQQPHFGRLLVNTLPIQELGSYPYHHVAYIPQESFFFEGTLKSNIILDNPFDSALFYRALEMSCFVPSCNDLLGFRITEDGSNLSGGQRQRLAIARALYKNPDFYVLDECTSALNQELERKVLKNIISFNREAIILCVSHNPGLSPLFQRHLSLDNGNLTVIK